MARTASIIQNYSSESMTWKGAISYPRKQYEKI